MYINDLKNLYLNLNLIYEKKLAQRQKSDQERSYYYNMNKYSNDPAYYE